MSAIDVYNCGFDEDDGKSISATTSEECGGRLRTDSGETACVESGVIVDEYWIDHAATATDYPDDETSNEQAESPLSEAFHDRGPYDDWPPVRREWQRALGGEAPNDFTIDYGRR